MGKDGPSPGWLKVAVCASAHAGTDGPQRRLCPPFLALGVVGAAHRRR
jgi:MYXO-CTERM domain-containing protein